jgi:uncharacterized protein YlxW (UPF0749 family)
MTWSPDVNGPLVIVSIMIGAVALALGIFLVLRLSAMRRDYRLLQGRDGKDSFVEAVARKTEEVEQLRAEVEQLRAELGDTRVDLARALRHVAVIRYDAFGDMGGRMSFTAALVDDHGDGILVTTIHARAESRTYIKGLRSGEADVLLSPEEEQAVETVRRSLS